MLIRRNKNLSFEALINKIKSRISSWQIPLLSQAGRNTLIKSVASAILIYDMPVLRLPNKTIDTIDKMLRSFWWGDGEGNKKMNTLKWNELHKPITEGGL